MSLVLLAADVADADMSVAKWIVGVVALLIPTLISGLVVRMVGQVEKAIEANTHKVEAVGGIVAEHKTALALINQEVGALKESRTQLHSEIISLRERTIMLGNMLQRRDARDAKHHTEHEG